MVLGEETWGRVWSEGGGTQDLTVPCSQPQGLPDRCWSPAQEARGVGCGLWAWDGAGKGIQPSFLGWTSPGQVPTVGGAAGEPTQATTT